MIGVFVTTKWTQVFSSELFSANDTKPAAYAHEKGPMSGAAYIDKRGREPGSGRTPDKKEARTGLESGNKKIPRRLSSSRDTAVALLLLRRI